MKYYRQNWPYATIPPKLHMLEDYGTDFISKWRFGFGIYGEQGGESVHNKFNKLKELTVSPNQVNSLHIFHISFK